MFRIAVLTAALVTVLALVSVASADSPHFIKGSSGLSGSSVTCTFKEAGLGNLGTTTVNITCSASASAVYVCVNGGGKHPQAANKETVNSEVSGSAPFQIRNGSTSGTLTVAAPGPGDFSCPGGQTLALASVTYSNVSVSGAGASLDLADQTFTDPNVPS